MEDIVLNVAKEAALLAGEKIRHAVFSKSKGVNEKSSNTDLVTETDVACEEIIKKKINQHFPLHKIIGEEENSTQQYQLSDDPTWTIDPIDGTVSQKYRHILTFGKTFFFYFFTTLLLASLI